MKVATWGSKVCDDALRYSKNQNVCRMVEISPFSLRTPHFDKMQNIYHEWSFYGDNDFLNKIFSLDYSKQVLKHITDSQCEYVVLSLDSMRLFLREFTLSDGTFFRLREEAGVVNHLPEIRTQIEKDLALKIVQEKVIRPMAYDDETLEYEIKAFCELLMQHFDTKKIILLKIHNVYQYIDKNNMITPALDMVHVVNKQNYFYDRCTDVFSKYIDCQTIECPSVLVGDTRRWNFNIFHYTLFYYEYINKCIDAVGRNEYREQRKQVILNEYICKQNLEIEELIYKPLIDLAYHRRQGRKLVLVGKSVVFEYNLRKKYGIIPNVYIEYDAETSEESIKQQLEAIKGKKNEYLCIVPKIYENVPILKLLWMYGYGFNSGYISNVHNAVMLKGFQGLYEDFYGNRIEAKRKINLELRGIGNKFYFGKGESPCDDVIILLSQTYVRVADDVQLEKKGFSSTMYDGASLEIGEDTLVRDWVHIRGSFFTNTRIGARCEIGEAAVIFNGDGHAIFDLHTGKNVNYDLNNVPEYKREIIVEDDIYIGDNCFILSGSKIPSGSVIRDGSFINKVFSVSSILSGMPAREEKEV